MEALGCWPTPSLDPLSLRESGLIKQKSRTMTVNEELIAGVTSSKVLYTVKNGSLL